MNLTGDHLMENFNKEEEQHRANLEKARFKDDDDKLDLLKDLKKSKTEKKKVKKEEGK